MDYTSVPGQALREALDELHALHELHEGEARPAARRRALVAALALVRERRAGVGSWRRTTSVSVD